MMGGYGGMMGGFGGMGWIWMILQLAILVGVVYFIVTLVKGSTRRTTKYNKGIETLEERYAKGEISELEFTNMKKVLMG